MSNYTLISGNKCYNQDKFIKHNLIVIPGLGNNVNRHIWAMRGWKKFGIEPIVFDTRWKTEELGFKEKFNRLVKLVDSLTGKELDISVLGNSAGSSLGLNLFATRQKQISHLIINCGRVRDGDWPWFTFNQATATSPSFKESVLEAQKVEKTLSDDDRKKILTLRPIFDEVVPPTTVPISGAKNEVMFSLEHSLSIALNMTLFKRRLIEFISNN